MLAKQNQSTLLLNHRTQWRTSIFSRNTIPADGGAGVKAFSVPASKASSVTWSRIAFYFKVARIPFLIIAIYGLGYRKGVTDTVRNPLKLQQGTFETLLLEMGVDSQEDVEIVSERGVSGFSTLQWFIGRSQVEAEDPRALKVANVGREIINTSRRYVRKHLEAAISEAKKQYEGEIIKEDVLARKLGEDPSVEFYIHALERLEGAQLEGIENWQYVLVSSPVVR
jgi:hypothetical protein